MSGLDDEGEGWYPKITTEKSLEVILLTVKNIEKKLEKHNGEGSDTTHAELNKRVDGLERSRAALWGMGVIVGGLGVINILKSLRDWLLTR